MRVVVLMQIGRGCDRCSGHGRGRRGLGDLLLDVDLFFEGVAQIVRCSLELAEALTKRSTKLRQLAGAEHNQRDHEDDEQL